MPVSEVDSEPIPVRRFDVIGQLNFRNRCVEHVGFSLETKDLIAGPLSPLRVIDMAPPISENDADENFLRHLVGNVASGSETDSATVELLENFYKATSGKLEVKQLPSYFPLPVPYRDYIVYVVHPHVVEGFIDEDDEVHPARYSCSGYVFEGYRRARLTLLAADALPELTFRQISKADPRLRAARISEPPELLEWVGLQGDGPWPVMMPGYLMASLKRSAEEIRRTTYTPTPADMTFPPTAPAASPQTSS